MVVSRMVITILTFLAKLFTFDLTVSITKLCSMGGPGRARRILAVVFKLMFFTFIIIYLPLVGKICEDIYGMIENERYDPLSIFCCCGGPGLFFGSIVLSMVSINLFFVVDNLLGIFGCLDTISSGVVSGSPSLATIITMLLILTFVIDATIIIIYCVVFIRCAFLTCNFGRRLPLKVCLPEVVTFSVGGFVPAVGLFVNFVN